MDSDILVYDTTLRDGAQSVGVTFSLGDKLQLMEALDDLEVHYIEAGWPGSNPKDEAFFSEARNRKLTHARLAAFGSTRSKDIPAEKDRNLDLLLRSGAPVLTIFGKAWDLHVKEALGTSNGENLEMIYTSVQYLKKHVDEVIFDAEHFFDGLNANGEYAMKCLEAAVQGGADWLVLCDTNGGVLPDRIREGTRQVLKAFDQRVGIHAHNDAGCAVANTLEAVDLGAKMVQGTMNGLGERCGNANLCIVLPNLSLKKNLSTIGDENLKKLQTLSHFVSEVSNTTPDDHMPFVGQHAFSHKGGIHVSAIRKNSKTYEHINPELVGNRRSTTISELSGKSNILEKTKHLEVGQRLTGETAKRIVEKVKELEAQGYHFEGAEASFELLSEALTGNLKKYFTLHGYRVIIWNNGDGNTWSEVTIKASVPEDVSHRQGHSDSVEHTSADGNGPVEALDKALRKVLEKFYPNISEIRLIDYKVRILNEESGSSAVTRVIINSADEETSWSTVGVSENIIEASWQALTDSLIYKLKKDEDKLNAAGGNPAETGSGSYTGKPDTANGSKKNSKEEIYGTIH